MGKPVCPFCGSGDVPFVRKDAHPDVWITIRRLRRCDACGAVYEPPSSPALGVVVLLLGVGLAVAPWSMLIEYLSPLRIGLLAFTAYGVLCCLYGGLQVVKGGIAAIQGQTRIYQESSASGKEQK